MFSLTNTFSINLKKPPPKIKLFIILLYHKVENIKTFLVTDKLGFNKYFSLSRATNILVFLNKRYPPNQNLQVDTKK